MPIPRRTGQGENSFLSSKQQEFVVPKESLQSIEKMGKEFFGDYIVSRDTHNFLDWLQGQLGEDTVSEMLLSAEIRLDEEGNMVFLDCGARGLNELKNLPDSLEELFCYSNNLTSLENLPPNLIVLRCFFNKITKLVNLPRSLKSIDCHKNKISELDYDLPNLEELFCYDNNLSEKEKEKIFNYCNKRGIVPNV